MDWIVLLIFLILVLVIWFALTRSAKKYEPDFKTGSHTEEAIVEQVEEPAAEFVESAKAAEMPEVAEQFIVQPAEIPVETIRAAEIVVVPDDLKIIEGIGPKVNSLLNDAGIFTFSQLAETEESKIREILDQAGLRLLNPATWAEQAQLAAAGKMDDLKVLQERLTAGRRS